MLKLLGCAAILSGSLGLVSHWARQRRQKQRLLKELIELFARGGYAMGSCKMRLEAFFRTYRTDHAVLSAVTKELAEALLSHACPSGEQLWKDVWNRHRGELGLDREAWELLVESGSVFFGMHLQENLRRGDLAQKQLQELLELEIRDFREKQKIAVPLGLLCGLLLILMLI